MDTSHAPTILSINTATNNTTEPQPSPSDHARPPTSSSGTSSKRTSFQSHARAMSSASHAANAPRSNRFSVSFPLSVSRDPSSSFETSSDKETNSADFLTAIATQERRVLELKEELQKADADLTALKRQWAYHEAAKKKEDAKRLSKLQTLHTSSFVGSDDDSSGAGAWLQKEMERRKTLLHETRRSNRTVFSGSRHTRTLSLLSPGTRDGPSSLSHPQPHLNNSPPICESPQQLPKSTTTPMREPINPSHDASVGQASDSATHNLKKIATEVYDGLYTFLEDIRQATVGEEATQTQGTVPRRGSAQNTKAKKQSSRNNLRTDLQRAQSTSAKLAPRKNTAGPPDLTNSSFWKEYGLDSPAGANAKKPTKPKLPAKTASPVSPRPPSEAWDWDESPVVSRSSSALSADTLQTTVSGSGSPAGQRSEPSSKRNSIPWPAIAKETATNLRRTASHLMSEWERSLTPTPGQEYRGDDYIGFEASGAVVASPRPNLDIESISPKTD